MLSFLLRRGYSPALGARPLKRTVERYVLLPVARAIARGAILPGSIVRLVAGTRDVDIQIERPSTPGDEPQAQEVVHKGLAALRTRVGDLVLRMADLRERAQIHADRRAELLARSRAPGFWDDRVAARRDMDEIHRWEGVFSALENLDRRVGDTARHVEKPVTTPREATDLAERTAELEREAAHLVFLLTTDDRTGLADALVDITRVKSRGPTMGAVDKVADMYAGFARRHHLSVEVLGECRSGEPGEDGVVLLVTRGAFRLLENEAGLHQFSRRGRAAIGRGQEHETDRELVRVDVLAVPETTAAVAPETLRVRTGLSRPRAADSFASRPSPSRCYTPRPCTRSRPGPTAHGAKRWIA